MTCFDKRSAARDVIAEWLENWLRELVTAPQLASCDLKRHILSAPEPVRLELAGMLNPWRPIEMAPKDGRLIRNLSANGERIQPLWWAWSANAQKHAWCGMVNGTVLSHEPQPTHWLPEVPLPAPPSEDKP